MRCSLICAVDIALWLCYNKEWLKLAKSEEVGILGLQAVTGISLSGQLAATVERQGGCNWLRVPQRVCDVICAQFINQGRDLRLSVLTAGKIYTLGLHRLVRLSIALLYVLDILRGTKLRSSVSIVMENTKPTPHISNGVALGSVVFGAKVSTCALLRVSLIVLGKAVGRYLTGDCEVVRHLLSGARLYLNEMTTPVKRVVQGQAKGTALSCILIILSHSLITLSYALR